MALIADLWANCAAVVQAEMLLAPYSTWRVGGKADWMTVVQTRQELTEIVLCALSHDIPVTILGRGANVLISDRGVRGLVVINRTHQFTLHDDGFLEADSGCDTAGLRSAAERAGWGGLTCLLKVPGTVGGAVVMNAGDTGKGVFIGPLVTEVDIVSSENRQVIHMRGAELAFGYRASRFQQNNDVILSVGLRLVKMREEDLLEARTDILERKAHQPLGLSIGSTFRNPPGDYAGRLIEEAGLKGVVRGGASISLQHANFMLNDGQATAGDMVDLIDLVKKRVFAESGVRLQEEVRYVGDFV